jgi:prepilin-type N-terminal cleavage/methylation domain-containing protein
MKTKIATSNRGFTLIEFLLGTIIAGIALSSMSIVIGHYFNGYRTTKTEAQKSVNIKIAQALIEYAQSNTQAGFKGKIQAPYQDSALWNNAVVKPSDTTPKWKELTQFILSSGVDPALIGDDNSQSHNLRVLQVANNITYQVPLYFRSGPLVLLTYQFGAVYSTACPRADSTCNTTSQPPGSSPALTATNYATWKTTGTDFAPIFVSTLPMQRVMLRQTAQTLDYVRDSLLSYFRRQQINAVSPNDPTNWWPGGSLAGANQATNEKCADGWYPLSTATILSDIGIDPLIYGVTAWGGSIQFCRDYAPAVAGQPPHYGALRINKNVTSAAAPDNATDVIVTF